MGIFDFNKPDNTFETGTHMERGDELLTRKEVKEMLKVSYETLRIWERKGKLKAYYLTPSTPTEERIRPEDYRGKRYKKSEIEKLIQP